MRHQQPHPPIYADISEWPIYKLHASRAEFVESIKQATLHFFFEKHSTAELEELLEKCSYKERIRIKEDPWRVDPPDDRQFWRKIRKELAEIAILENELKKREQIEAIYLRVVDRYAQEIVGTFNKKTFRFARKFLTTLFKWLLNTAAGNRGIFWGSRKRLYEKLIVHGPVEEIRELAKNHVLVVLPTHFSNLDSILVGYAMDTMLGLPSFLYGAGLNLYNFGPAAYFMNRLGAYRLDRRKINPIYLETLKTMSQLGLEWHTNTLFFPGGTRSRSGILEDKLKLGLLGTTVEAQQALFARGENKKIVIVPLVVSYHFVLEAKFLIEQHLRRKGKEQYLRTRDQSFSIRRWLKFFWQFFSASSDITLSFGKPMDVLGNMLDKDGLSFSKHGELIDLREYFQSEGKITTDKQRESEYTRLLASKVVKRFHQENVVLSSHLVAFAAFRLFQYQHRNLDLFALLSLPEDEMGVSFTAFCQLVEKYLAALQQMENQGELLLSDTMSFPIEEIVRNGISKLGNYHSEKPLKITQTDDVVVTQNLKLLYYYHNRLEGFALHEEVDLAVFADLPAYSAD